jgi:tRNA(fMet)-specific endonuclease VapC
VFLIDSSTCISLLRNRLPRTAKRLRHAGIDNITISSICAAELYHGAEKSARPDIERRKVQELLTLIRPVEFGTNAAMAYGLVRSFLERSGNLIGPFDMLTAAHALSEGATLVTQNVREFSRVPGLSLEDWVG